MEVGSLVEKMQCFHSIGAICLLELKILCVIPCSLWMITIPKLMNNRFFFMTTQQVGPTIGYTCFRSPSIHCYNFISYLPNEPYFLFATLFALGVYPFKLETKLENFSPSFLFAFVEMWWKCVGEGK